MRYFASTGICLMAGVFTPAGQAETTATTTFQVGAQVQSSCRIQADDLRFKALASAESRSLNASATLNVHCTRGAYSEVRLDTGQQPDPASERRRLVGEGERHLGYRLQVRPADESPDEEGWDTLPAPLAGDGKARSLTLHGRLDEAPAAPGLLTDTLTITLVY